mmetsp:Transcript_52421/g.166729  ORF Transcript_52421/g.166729 Transcript_52421/m.166729 type:complete len:278 (-) Transcript_52421:48-881(-)
MMEKGVTQNPQFDHYSIGFRVGDVGGTKGCSIFPAECSLQKPKYVSPKSVRVMKEVAEKTAGSPDDWYLPPDDWYLPALVVDIAEKVTAYMQDPLWGTPALRRRVQLMMEAHERCCKEGFADFYLGSSHFTSGYVLAANEGWQRCKPHVDGDIVQGSMQADLVGSFGEHFGGGRYDLPGLGVSFGLRDGSLLFHAAGKEEDGGSHSGAMHTVSPIQFRANGGEDFRVALVFYAVDWTEHRRHWVKRMKKVKPSGAYASYPLGPVGWEKPPRPVSKPP